MIHELREYTTVPGRMPALLARFRDHTMDLFARHGIDCVFFSRTTVGENSNNELVYLLRYESLADRERRWSAFLADPDWQSARDASEADGPIVERVSSRFLAPEEFSAQ